MITIKEQKATGKAVRKEQISREDHGIWKVKTNRKEVIELIQSQEKFRTPHLLPLRHERMLISPFTFFRGSAILQAHDIASAKSTSLFAQVCGDAHISNFGIFGSPERRLVFDINDFDETFFAPFEVDIKRLCASIEICGRDRGFKKEERKVAVKEAARTYRECMRRFSDMGNLDVWYLHLDIKELVDVNSSLIDKAQKKYIQNILNKAMDKNSVRAIKKLTEVVDGQLRIKSDPPIVVPIRDLSEEERKHVAFNIDVQAALDQYADSLPPDRRTLLHQYEPVEMAHKVVGVGSVGTKAWILVMKGREQGDPLVLQIKEAMPSVFDGYFGNYPHPQNGRRVAEGQKAIQTAGDIMLGWLYLTAEDGRIGDYYIRQLWDEKGSIELEDLSPGGLKGLSALCAWTLAHAHAKTGNRHAIAGYLGKNDTFDLAMVTYAELYADQSEADFEVFSRWVKDSSQ